jgi:long-chain acyl-CoA synthetase
LGTVDAKGNITIRGREKTMILSGSGQNIYPEEIEAKLNNMPYVMESVVLESSTGKLVALVYPDKEAVDAEQLSSEQLEEKLEENRKNLNNILGNYEKVTRIKIHSDEFEKTPKKSIKRFLYSAD